MIALLLLAPLLAALLIIVLRRGPAALGLAGSLGALVGAAGLLWQVRHHPVVRFTWPGLPGLPYGLGATPFTALLAVIVAVVALLIFVYARGYMAHERGKVWFWASMSLFVAAMQLLVLSTDWLLFVTGWELMGLASFLLIATWHWEEKARRGAVKAFLLTRFTDLGLYLGIVIILLQSGTSLMQAEPGPAIPLVGALALLLAVMGKSAQVPFQSWLAGAMAGPTPVSALLHSATMVAAGVVLLLRAYPLLPPASLPYIGAVGGATIVLTGFTALCSNDIKQLLAASTSSQLGFMLVALAAGFPGAAVSHLVAHAFMKSGLFLSAGLFQHQNESTLFARISGSGRTAPVALAGWALAGLALAGVPPLVGYWSKDSILAAGLGAGNPVWYFGVAAGGALLTALYIGRSLGLLWRGPARPAADAAGLSLMRAGLLGLVGFVVGGGFFLADVLRFVGYALPETPAAQLTGLTAAALGLGLGWHLRAADVGTPVLRFVQDNYPIGGGFPALVGRPTLALAAACGRFDEYLHRQVLGLGGAVLALAGRGRRADTQLRQAAAGVGPVTLALAARARRADAGLAAAVQGLAGAFRRAGQLSRPVQSGLVHRELLWTMLGVLALVASLFVSLFRWF